ncbi:autotransporter outer membrane beta-barrel domain-containing protein [Ochrobactrum grignonense]|nr:autotransporter outer membrane beta-barrel domain-containing protein [Brucella grignonensis]
MTFGGMISPLVRNPVKDVWLGIAHFDQAPAVAATPKLASTPLFSLNMKDRYGGKQDPSISVDFKPFTFATNQDQGNVIGHLQELWDMADSRSGSLFDPFVGVQSAQQYQQTLGAIAHDGQFARAANQVHETFASMNRLMSCPMFVGEGVLLRESDCVWGRVNTNWVQRRMTYSDNDYHIRQTALQVGAQKEIMRDWFAAASFSYGFGDMSSSRVTGTNDTFSGGIALKHTIGPWQFATAIHGALKQVMSSATHWAVSRPVDQSPASLLLVCVPPMRSKCMSGIFGPMSISTSTISNCLATVSTAPIFSTSVSLDIPTLRSW